MYGEPAFPFSVVNVPMIHSLVIDYLPGYYGWFGAQISASNDVAHSGTRELQHTGPQTQNDGLIYNGLMIQRR